MAWAVLWRGLTCRVCTLPKQPACCSVLRVAVSEQSASDRSCSFSQVMHWLQTQMRKGFSRVEASLDDVVLDLPKAREDLAKLTQQALKEGWLVAES